MALKSPSRYCGDGWMDLWIYGLIDFLSNLKAACFFRSQWTKRRRQVPRGVPDPAAGGHDPRGRPVAGGPGPGAAVAGVRRGAADGGRAPRKKRLLLTSSSAPHKHTNERTNEPTNRPTDRPTKTQNESFLVYSEIPHEFQPFLMHCSD